VAGAVPAACVFLLTLAWGVSAVSEVEVRVGVYDNPPKVVVSSEGAVSGLYPDLLEAIAEDEGWVLQYVAGTWTECWIASTGERST